MPRVKRGVQHVKRRRNLLKKTKGYKWGRKNKIKLAKTAVLKAGVHAYRDRRLKKRTNRGLWQINLGAYAKERGLSYSQLMDLLKKNQIEVNRKMLAEIAKKQPVVLDKIIEQLKK